jgi:hypothetical protein
LVAACRPLIAWLIFTVLVELPAGESGDCVP